MKVGRHIRKVFFLGIWIAAGTGILVLLIAAIKVRQHKTCKGYSIEIAGAENKRFIDENTIAGMLRVNGVIKGRSLRRFDLNGMEAQMEKNPWIKNAELFFDNKQILKVRIEEREPVARVFTTSGNSFYIDSTGKHLPLSDKFSAKLPVFTGFPTEHSQVDSTDSVLTTYIKQVSEYLLHSPFWMAQIAQVDITEARGFEMIPTVGHHVIEFGTGENYEKKFNRLMLFYQRVLSNTGMDVYERLNIQYDKQVIGVRKKR
jgi:cell division protein FtsQ